MRMGFSDALSIFRTWERERCPVRIQGSFPLFAFASRCKVVRVDDREVRLMSDDSDSELIVRLTPDTPFNYDDNRNITGDERKYGEAVIIPFSSAAIHGDKFDHIILAAERTP